MYMLSLAFLVFHMGLPGVSDSEESACSEGDLDSSLGWEDSLEKGMATHSSILAWRIPWIEKMLHKCFWKFITFFVSFFCILFLFTGIFI